jgi:GNAT superfamily N-acetyltransferase
MKIRYLNWTSRDEISQLIFMFYSLIFETFEDIALSDMSEYVEEIMYWKKRGDTYITLNDEDEITGFIYGYVVPKSFTKSQYIGEYAYVKPEFRKGKSAYLLYNKIVDRAHELRLPIFGKAYLSDNNVDKILNKFADKKVFTEYYRCYKKEA